jgi:excisionase family DNA binding protein
MTEHLTGDEVAALLGVSRRTVYRWVERRRLPREWWRRELLVPYIGLPKLPKGPARNPNSVRYVYGRHRFDEVRNRK